MCLLEKAWSKLIGGYEKTKGGHPLTVFAHLTNKPGYKIDHSDDSKSTDELWEKFYKATCLGYAITASTSYELDEV
jgi:hypothetical protein